MKSVQPEWCRKLSIQQQSVLFLAGRGPDGIAKAHPCKAVQVAYRACVFVAAKYGRSLQWGERADTFMSMDMFSDTAAWNVIVRQFFLHADDLPHHYLMHLMHGVQILGYKHPDERIRGRWLQFYAFMVDDMHLRPESESEMDERLGDWDQKHWDHPPPDAFAVQDGSKAAIATALVEAHAATNLKDFAAAIAKIPSTEQHQILQGGSSELKLNREGMRKLKYVQGYADIDPDQLLGLLWLLGEWSSRAHPDGTPGGNKGRAQAAIDALREFHRNPLTVEQVRALMREAGPR